jgi:hypothetical protein
VSNFSKADVVQILTNLDIMSAAHIPRARRAWAHLFIACSLIQLEMKDPEMLTRERFMALAGKVHDRLFDSLRSPNNPEA